MATAEPIRKEENLKWSKDYKNLLSTSQKCIYAAEHLNRKRKTIQGLRAGAVFSGALGVIGSFFTLGAAVLLSGAVLMLLLALLTEVTVGLLKATKMKRFEEDWERAKATARRLMMNQSPDDCNVEYSKEWAKKNLNKAEADAIVYFLSAPSSCKPNTTDRIKRLNQNQLELLFKSLVNVIIANLSAFELITASMALKKADAAEIMKKISRDIDNLAEKEDKRRKAEEKRKRTLDAKLDRQEDFCIHSKTGGTFQLKMSDIILDIPPGAIPVEEAHIKAAVCTDFQYIHTKFQLDDNERIVSPLVQYMLEPDEFLKPVSVSLPHLLPDNIDSDKVNVYHVSMNEDGTWNKQRVVNYTGSVQQDNSTKGQKVPRITIKATPFSYFFICAVCETKADDRFSALWAAVSGEFAPSSPREHQRFKAKVFIWDKRLSIIDFRADYGVPPYAEAQPLLVFKHRENTKLRILVKMQPEQGLASYLQGRNLNEREEVFDLPHELTSDECLTKKKSVPLPKEWLFHTNYAAASVTVCVEVEHLGHKQQSVTNKFLYRTCRPSAVDRRAQAADPQPSARSSARYIFPARR